MEKELGKKLKKLRLEAGLSEKELAKILEVQKVTLKKWESGITTPRLCKLIAICNFFNVSVNYLVGLRQK